MTTAVFTFGRMNPPTVGHQKLVDKVAAVAKQAKAKNYVFLSHTQNNKKDPLNYNQKISYAKKAFGNSVTKSRSKTVIQVMQELEKKGHQHVIMVVGSDRVSEFDSLLQKYNGKDFKFSTIQVVSAGERDPDAEGVSGMSASKMRAAALAGKENDFKKGLSPKLRSVSNKIYNDIRSIMEEEEIRDEELEIIEHWEVSDEMCQELDEDRQPLTIQQRRKIGLRMRRLAPRMQRLKKLKAKRMAPAERLKQRARKAAINLLRKRAAGASGANYANLSASQKIAVDKMIMKKRPAIANLAKRLFPKIRKKEMERLQQHRKRQQTNENIAENTKVAQDSDISKRRGTQPAKYHKGLSKSTKAKRDAQFKKQASMSDDNPAAYKPAPGDANAKTKPSKYTKAYKDMYGETTRADIKMIPVKEPSGKTVFRRVRRDIKIEDQNVKAARERIKREKEQDRSKHDRMMDRARSQDTMAKNRQTEEVNEMAKRGRPKKSGETGIEHIQMQLRKVVSLRGQKPVEFENGKKLKMTPAQAMTIDKKIGALRMGKDKADFINFINKSPENMKKALDPKFKKPEQFKSYLMNAVKESKARAMNEEVEKPSEERVRFRHFTEGRLHEKSMEGLKKKAEKSGISYGTLKKVYDRGVAAWKSGHRPGTTPSQWGYARVNAFITKKKKGGLNHDQDLA